MLVGALAIIAARQLFPSIDAETGSGALFVLGAWGVGLLALVDLVLRPGPGAAAPAFVFLVALSTAFAAYKFPPLNMLGEWIGVVGVWAALRRSASPIVARQVALLIVILGISEALLAYRQVRFDIPELLERYRRGDVGVMRELARAGVEPGFMFQSRLEAGLPWGTFGHTNSLAGFLLLTAPFAFVWLAETWRAQATSSVWLARGLVSATTAVILVGLGMTKGRSAWVGTVAALSVILLASPLVRSIIARRWLLAATAGVLVAGLFLWKAGNASESLRYRVEYWRGTTPIVVAHPWVGVGWGNFRDHYLEHKLAESSEEVADPHNFLMELAACAGIPAALAYLWWLAATVWGLLARQDDNLNPTPQLAAANWLALAVVLLLVCGFVVALGYSGSWTDVGGWGFPIAFIAVFAVDHLAPSMSVGSWRTATAAAIVGLHVHLLAAGGVGHPGTMLACWGLAAATGSSTAVGGWKRWRDLASLTSLFAIGALLGSPQLARRTVERDPILGRIRNVIDAPISPDAAGQLYDRALALTLGDADLWAEVARWRRRRMGELNTAAEQEFRSAQAAIGRAIELQPLRSQFWHDRGMLRIEATARGVEGLESASRTVADFKTAADRYPNSPARQADAAVVLAATSQSVLTAAGVQRALDEWRTIKNLATVPEIGERLGREAAQRVEDALRVDVRRQASLALKLDAATPHLDKKLLMAERAYLRALTDELKRMGVGE